MHKLKFNLTRSFSKYYYLFVCFLFAIIIIKIHDNDRVYLEQMYTKKVYL